jgi:hypothetical protein
MKSLLPVAVLTALFTGGPCIAAPQTKTVVVPADKEIQVVCGMAIPRQCSAMVEKVRGADKQFKLISFTHGSYTVDLGSLGLNDKEVILLPAVALLIDRGRQDLCQEERVAAFSCDRDGWKKCRARVLENEDKIMQLGELLIAAKEGGFPNTPGADNSPSPAAGDGKKSPTPSKTATPGVSASPGKTGNVAKSSSTTLEEALLKWLESYGPSPKPKAVEAPAAMFSTKLFSGITETGEVKTSASTAASVTSEPSVASGESATSPGSPTPVPEAEVDQIALAQVLASRPVKPNYAFGINLRVVHEQESAK